MPQGLLLGAGVSVFTVIALIAAAIIFSKRRKSNVNAPFVPVIVETVDEEISEPIGVEMDLDEEPEAPEDEEFSLIEEEISAEEETVIAEEETETTEE